MNKNITDFGKLCRKYRIENGWSMTDAAEKLGFKQNHISQIENGKANPTLDYVTKCLKIYKISNNAKADFIAKALASQNRLSFETDVVTIIPNDALIKLMAILIFNLEEPQSIPDGWEIVFQAVKILSNHYHTGPIKTIS